MSFPAALRNGLVFVALAVGLVVACGGSSSNNAAGTQSALCGPTVTCGQSRKCDPNLGCVDCVADTDCGGSTKYCVLGTCVACKANSDCGASNPACWPGDHQCHASCAGQGNSACAVTILTPLCDATTGACEGCAQNSDCGGTNTTTAGGNGNGNGNGNGGGGGFGNQGKFCNPTFRQCVECSVDHDCPTSAPKCTVTGQCEQCLSNADCGGSTPVCDASNPTNPRCIAGCSADKDCTDQGSPHCNTATKLCVACLSSNDCPTSAKLCSTAGRCVQCQASSDCSGTTPLCSDQGACVQCVKQTDCPSNGICFAGRCN